MKPFAKFSYLLMCAGALVLAVTGIGVFITGKAPMTRWGLMLHIAAAPVFAIGLLLVSLTWPRRAAAFRLFWLFLLSGLTVMLTGVLPMTPVFGADGQHFLYLTHRYAALVCAAALVLFSLVIVLRPTPPERIEPSAPGFRR